MLDDVIARLDRWLARHRPTFHGSLRPGATDADLDALAERVGVTLPPAFRALYRWRDGQRGAFHEPGLAGAFQHHMSFLPLAGVARAWSDLTGLAAHGDFDRVDWWDPRWVPFLQTPTGDYLCVDLAGCFGGPPDQIVKFRHDDATRWIEAPDLETWLHTFVASLERGEWAEQGNDFHPVDEAAWQGARAGLRRAASAGPRGSGAAAAGRWADAGAALRDVMQEEIRSGKSLADDALGTLAETWPTDPRLAYLGALVLETLHPGDHARTALALRALVPSAPPMSDDTERALVAHAAPLLDLPELGVPGERDGRVAALLWLAPAEVLLPALWACHDRPRLDRDDLPLRPSDRPLLAAYRAALHDADPRIQTRALEAAAALEPSSPFWFALAKQNDRTVHQRLASLERGLAAGSGPAGALFEQLVPSEIRTHAEMETKRGELLLHAGRPADALAWARELRSRRGDDGVPDVELEALVALGRPEEALAATAGRAHHVRVERAALLVQLGREEEAVAEVLAGLAESPSLVLVVDEHDDLAAVRLRPALAEPLAAARLATERMDLAETVVQGVEALEQLGDEMAMAAAAILQPLSAPTEASLRAALESFDALFRAHPEASRAVRGEVRTTMQLLARPLSDDLEALVKKRPWDAD